MRVKASWVAFFPITVGALLLHIYHIFFLGGDEITQALFGDYSLLINKSTEPELIVLLAVVLFVFVLFFSVIDRKTSSFCEIKSSPLSGIFLILSGLLLGVDSTVDIVNMFSEGSQSSSSSVLALSVLGVATALLFAIVGMGLLVGFNISKKIRVFMVLPTIWSAIGLVSVFVSHRKEAPSFGFFDVFAWVFLTLFLFNNSMVLCGVEIKNPVKSSFVYGLLFTYFSVMYCISQIHSSVSELGMFDVTALVTQLLIGSLGLYALFSLFSLSSKMITKEKAAELGVAEDSSDTEPEEEKKNEDETPEAAFGVGSTKYVTAEFEKIRLEKAAKKAKERTGNIPSVIIDEEADEEDEEPMSTLDKIDQLIMELSDENDD